MLIIFQPSLSCPLKHRLHCHDYSLQVLLFNCRVIVIHCNHCNPSTLDFFSSSLNLQLLPIRTRRWPLNRTEASTSSMNSKAMLPKQSIQISDLLIKKSQAKCSSYIYLKTEKNVVLFLFPLSRKKFLWSADKLRRCLNQTGAAFLPLAALSLFSAWCWWKMKGRGGPRGRV